MKLDFSVKLTCQKETLQYYQMALNILYQFVMSGNLHYGS